MTIIDANARERWVVAEATRVVDEVPAGVLSTEYRYLLIARIIGLLLRPDQPPAAPPIQVPEPPQRPILTKCETAVLLQLARGGSTNKQIARALVMCESTVKVHVKAILRKLGLANRTQAACWAQQHHLMEGADNAYRNGRESTLQIPPA